MSEKNCYEQLVQVEAGCTRTIEFGHQYTPKKKQFGQTENVLELYCTRCGKVLRLDE